MTDLKTHNFFLTVIVILLISSKVFSQPCSSAPSVNTLVISPNPICPNNTPTLTIANSYSQTGIRYDWYASTVSSAGPYLLLSQTSPSIFVAPGVTVTTWYYVAVTCTNGNQWTQTPVVQVNLIPNTITVNNPTLCIGETTTLTAVSAGTLNWYTTPTSTQSIANGSALITPTLTTGNYTYYAEATNVCNFPTLRVPVTLTVNPLPVIGVSNGTICNGQSFSIVPNGAATYTYIPSVSPTVTTTYTVSGTSSVGCTSSSTLTVTRVNAPAATMSAPGGLVCPGSCFTVVPSGAVSYTFPAGNPVICPTGISVYIIKGTDINGCFTSAPCQVSLAPTPSIYANGGTICGGNSFTFTPGGAVTYSYSGGSAIVSPNITTNYTIVGFSSLGCASNTISCTVIVTNNTPNVVVNSGNICAGGNFTIIPSGANTYTFTDGLSTPIYSNAAIVVSPTVSTTYTVTGIPLGGGCTGIALSNVTANPNPTITITTNNNPACYGDLVSLVVQGADSYDWNNWAPASTYTRNVGPASTTAYTVTGKSSAGCVGSAAITLTINVCNSINAPAGRVVTKAFPNPFNDEIQISSSVQENVFITDASGKKVKDFWLLNGVASLDVRTLENGIYFIHIRGNIYKVIKN